jgi:hypothetical protein
MTMFQAAYDPGRFGFLPDVNHHQQPLTLVKHGVEVRIWVDHGAVVALARSGSAGVMKSAAGTRRSMPDNRGERMKILLVSAILRAWVFWRHR